MYSTPTDHLPKTIRDSDCRRRDEEIERRKSLFRQARAVASALRTITERQPKGQLTRADGAVLATMVLQNLRACVRKELIYRPTRRWMARQTGYSERTVSTSIGRLKGAKLAVVSRYAKGGRLGDRGKGLATEFRTGCLQFLCEQLEQLGYRVPKSLRDDLVDLAKWAAMQVGESTETHSDFLSAEKPIEKKVPGTSGEVDTVSRQPAAVARVARVERPYPARPGRQTSTPCAMKGLRDGAKLARPALGALARAALPFSAMITAQPQDKGWHDESDRNGRSPERDPSPSPDAMRGREAPRVGSSCGPKADFPTQLWRPVVTSMLSATAVPTPYPNFAQSDLLGPADPHSIWRLRRS